MIASLPSHPLFNGLLDEDRGLGIPHQLGSTASRISQDRLTSRRETLWAFVFQAVREKTKIIHLNEESIDKLSLGDYNEMTFPQSLELNVSIVKDCTAPIDTGGYVLVVSPNVGATMAGQHMGRFADMVGPTIIDEMKRVARRTSPSEDVIVSELVYLPARRRLANVTIREPICVFETPFAVTQSVSDKFIVPVSELGVSLQENRFVIRWSTKDKIVQFRSGHMLNSQHAPPVIRFLGEIARDGVTQLCGFDWGDATGFEFLPRIQLGNIILSAARWRLTRVSVGTKALATNALFREFFSAWRSQWDLPAALSLTYGDNCLPLNVEDSSCVDEIRAELRKSAEGACILQEELPSFGSPWLPSLNGGNHHAEIVVPMTLRMPQPMQVDPLPYVWRDRANRGLQVPGGNWVFVKLYGSKEDQDDLIASDMYRFVQELQRVAGTLVWFFVRYADPSAHVRLRIKIPLGFRYEQIFREVADWCKILIDDGKLIRFTFDTYEQELHRYGGESGITKAEEVFCADSSMVMKMLRTTLMDTRDVSIIVIIDDMLQSFGLKDKDVIIWLRKYSTMGKQVVRAYREQEKSLREGMLGNTGSIILLCEELAYRRKALLAASLELEATARQGRGRFSAGEMLRAFVHMTCNRLGVDAVLENRLISLLARTRESISAVGSTTGKGQLN